MTLKIESLNNKFISTLKIVQPTNKLDDILLLSLIISTVLLPYVPLSSSFFLSLEEIIIVLIGARLLQLGAFYIDKYVVLLLLFAFYTTFVILLNPNRTHLTEYFEVYKTIRYVVVYIFGIVYFFNKSSKEVVGKWIELIFYSLVIFNVFHYFDFFEFNQYVTSLYDSNGIDIKSFGKNSLGLPGPKRMIGTMGNPNDNAILFLFFFVYFIASGFKKTKSLKMLVLIFIAFIMIVFCQSRTSIVAMVGLFVMILFLMPKSKENWIYYGKMVLIIMLISLLYYFSSNTPTYLGNTNLVEVKQNTAVKGRFEVWKFLIESWMQKPLFGHGPNKSFMYDQKIYPENEYIFYLWRYGLVGLLFYFSILIGPLIVIGRKFKSYKFLIYTISFISIIALTNNPLTNPKFSIIYALIVGYCLSLYQSQNLGKYEENH